MTLPIRYRKLFPSLLLAISPAIVSPACLSGPSAAGEEIQQSRDPLNVATWDWWLQAAHSTQTTDMGPDTDRTCFLTGLGGHMEGGGEFASVTHVGGRYVLTVSTLQPASLPLRGSARCIATTRGRTADVSWSQGNPAVNLGPNLPAGGGIRSCFLTRISGKLRGGGEVIHAFESGGTWFLGGASQQEGVNGSAACITTDYRSGEWNWQAGRNAFNSNVPDEYRLESDPTFIKRCFLNGISGDFESNQPSMEVVWVAGPWDYPDGQMLGAPNDPFEVHGVDHWSMWLGAMTSNVQGIAICVW